MNWGRKSMKQSMEIRSREKTHLKKKVKKKKKIFETLKVNSSHGSHSSLTSSVLPPVTLLGRDYSPTFSVTIVFPITRLCSGCICGDKL